MLSYLKCGLIMIIHGKSTTPQKSCNQEEKERRRDLSTSSLIRVVSTVASGILFSSLDHSIWHSFCLFFYSRVNSDQKRAKRMPDPTVETTFLLVFVQSTLLVTIMLSFMTSQLIKKVPVEKETSLSMGGATFDLNNSQKLRISLGSTKNNTPLLLGGSNFYFFTNYTAP